MVRRAIACVAVLVWVSCSLAPASAQDDSGPTPAHISRVDGQVTLERAGQPDAAPLNMPVIAGDRLRTGDGYLEIMLADGSVLAVDRGTAVDFQSDDLVRLTDGRLRLNIPAPMRAASFRIDSPAGSVRISEAGEYRVTMLHGAAAGSAKPETQIELAVSRGAADIFTDEGSTRVRPGERAYASAGLLPSYTYTFNSGAVDDFDRWADGQPDDRSGLSSQYLPPDMREYSTTFDEYGNWQYLQPYGYVWYPRVASSWRPYYYGRWMSYPRYGWTWIGTDAFAWPTHHYGRWGYSAGVWFWIPASRWAPAYVSWAYAPGYVSWCPLGFDNRPVLNIGVTVGTGSRYRSPWNAWTVVASTHFGRGFVPERVVRTAAWAESTHPAFQVRQAAPDGRDIAVPRYVNRGDRIIESPTARPVAPHRNASGIAASRADTAPRTRTSTPADRDSRTAAPRSSVPVYRGNTSRVPPGPGYRTTPSSAAQSPARSRQTAPMPSATGDSPAYAPRYQPNYAPHYEPRQATGVERAAPHDASATRTAPPAGSRTAAPSGSSSAGSATSRGTAPAAGSPDRPAAARGGAAVPRRSGRGGGGGGGQTY